MNYVIDEELDLKKFGKLEPGELFVVSHKPYVKIDVRHMPKFCCNCAFGGDNPDFILAVNLNNGKIETFARDCGSRKVKDYNLDITI